MELEEEEIIEENYTKKVVKGAGIIFIFTLVALFFAYLMRVLLARNLSVEEYGLFYAVFSMFSFLILFRDLGLTRSLVKFIPEFKVKKQCNLIKDSIISIFSFQFVASAIITIILIIFSDFLAINYFHNAHASSVIRILALSFWLKPFILLCGGIFQGFQKMWQYASIDLTRSILVLILSFVGFNISKGVSVPSIATLITSILLLLIFIPLLLKVIPIEFFKKKFVIDKKLLKKLFGFGISTMAGDINWFIIGGIDIFILTYFAGLEQVGLYNASLPTASLLSYFGVAIATALLPVTSELWTKKNKKRLADGISKLHKYSFAIVIPFALIMFCFPELILNLLFGKNYIIASTSLRILSLAFIFMTLSRVNLNTLLGIGKPKVNIKIAIITVIFNLILNLILIGLLGMGILGASISALLTALAMFLLSLIKLKKFAKIRIPIIMWLKNIVAGVIFVLVALFLKELLVLNPYIEAILVVIIACLVYLASLFAFKIISTQEFKNLINLSK